MKKNQTLFLAIQQQINLEKHLKNKTLPDVNQIRNNYFYLIHDILDLFFGEKEIVENIIYQALFIHLPERINNIKNLKTLEKAIIEETIKATGEYCDPKMFYEITMEISCLENVFSQIKKVSRRYRKLLKLRLQGKMIKDIAGELNLSEEKIKSMSIEAADQLKARIKKIRKKAITSNLHWIITYSLILAE